MNQTINTIKSRRSIRAYKEEQIKEDELHLILEAGQYAPSSNNQQPWHFTVVQNKEVLNKINEATRNIIRNHPNKEFAKRAESDDFNIFYNAQTLIIISGDTKAISPQIDCSLALHNMFLAAESLDIGSCWVNVISHFLNSEESESLRGELAIPERYKPNCAGVFGYKVTEVNQTPPRKDNTVNFIK